VLFGEHPPAIRAAAAALGWMGDAGVASLSEALHHAKGPGRSAAGWVLSGRPERVPGLAQALVETLTEKDPAVRETAVRALTRIGRVDRETEAALLRVTNDPSIRVRIAVLRSLETFQHLGSEADEALARALRDPERAIRRPAIGVLGTRALGNPANATLLVGALRDPDPELRARAASALWDVQPLPVEAIHALERLRDDPDQSVRSCALRLLTGN
jgi:HEAT repeat protein